MTDYLVNYGRDYDSRTGAPKEDWWPRCPECGEICSVIYRQNGVIVGCENCVEDMDAWQVLSREN